MLGSPTSGGGATQHQSIHSRGMSDGHLLGHHASEGHPENVASFDARMVQHPYGIVGHVPCGIGHPRSVTPADATNVEQDQPKGRLEVADDGFPVHQRSAEAADEHQRRPIAMAFELIIDARTSGAGTGFGHEPHLTAVVYDDAMAERSSALLTGAHATPWLPTWSRRTLSIGAIVAMTIVLVAMLPVALPVAALVDVISKRSAALRTIVFFLLYLGCELVGIAACFGLWLSNLLRPGADRDRFVADNFRLQCWWARTLRHGAFRIFSMKADVQGQQHATPGPVLMFVRHCSIADTMLPVMLVSDPHRIVLRWVMKKELLWDPCLDIVGHRLRNCFVSRMPQHNAHDVDAIASLMDDLQRGDGVVLYPEGTRFTEAKRQRILDRATERGDQHLMHSAAALRRVLPPRLGGALALLGNNPGADVLFCSHTGLEGAASFWELLSGRIVGKTVHIKLWRVPFADIPTARSDQIEWLHGQWARVDAYIASHAER